MKNFITEHKLLLTISFVLISLSLFSQKNTDTKLYIGEGMYLKYLENNKLINIVPIGKNPYVYYDTFFKSYTIFYIDENGADAKIKLNYIQKNSDLLNLVRMIDEHGEVFNVKYFKEDGIISAFMEKKQNGFTVVLTIEGIKKNSEREKLKVYSDTPIYIKPDMSSQVVYRVKGNKVKVLEKINDKFYYITVNGIKGYLSIYMIDDE